MSLEVNQTNFISSQGAKSLESALENIFTDKKEETKIQKTRRIMGAKVQAITDNDLGTYLSEFQFLVDTWIDDYERGSFNGKTLNEILKEG